MSGEDKKGKKANISRLVVTVIAIVAVVLLLRHFGVFEYISLENMAKLKEWIAGFGAIGPVVYILLYIVACIFFLPGLPIAVLAGFAFGPIMGTVWASIGATLGATAAFLIARYAARDMVAKWVEGNEQFKKIDDGVRKHGWRMLMITRLVPIFPFNLQNYAYGLTDIKLSTYVLVSWVCMLPGAIAFCFAGGTLTSGGDLKTTFMYLAVAAVFFVLLSFIPGWIKKKQGSNMDL